MRIQPSALGRVLPLGMTSRKQADQLSVAAGMRPDFGQSRHSALARRRAAMQRLLAAQPKGDLAAVFSVGEHIIPTHSGTNLLGKANTQERLT